MSHMPEPLSHHSSQRTPAEQYSGLNTLAHQVQTLHSLSTPNANIYHAISTPDLSLSNLLDTFSEAIKEFDNWLECAQLVILTLEETVRDGVPVRSISEVDVLIQKFTQNIALLKDLSVPILDRQKVDESIKDEGEDSETDSNNKKDYTNKYDSSNILSAIERIQNEWLETKQSFTKIKKEMTESKHRRELLETMDQILASIEELNTNIFEYQEQRHSGFTSSDDLPFPRLSSSPSSSSRPMTPATPSNNEFSSRSDIALMQLDSRMEPLSARIDYLRSRLSAPNAPSDPNGSLSKKHNLLTNRWDVLKQEMESLRDELKDDRWVGLFKQVTGQATQMMDSLDRAVRQCKDFFSRAINRSDSPSRVSGRGVSNNNSRYNQRSNNGSSAYSQNSIQPQIPITTRNYQRLYKQFDAKRKYYVPAVNKMLTMLGSEINNRTRRDAEIIQKYNAMKSRWGSILEGVRDVQQDMPQLETIMDTAFIGSNSPPSSIPSSLASSPPISPSIRPIKGMFSPESGSPPKVSPYRSIRPDRDRSLSPSGSNARSPSLRSKSPSPRTGSPYGRALYPPNGMRRADSPQSTDRSNWQYNYSPDKYVDRYDKSYVSDKYSPYSPGSSSQYHRSLSPQLGYDRTSNKLRSKSTSRPESPIRPMTARPMSTRPISPAERPATGIPRPVTSMSMRPRRTTPATTSSGMASAFTRLSISPTPHMNRRRSETPSSIASDDQFGVDDDDDDSSGSPLSDTLHLMQRDLPPYIPVKSDPLDVEVGKVVNGSPISVKVERVSGGGGKYYFGSERIGQTRKVQMCKLINSSNGGSKVMVRVGGGWQDLDMFLLNHSLSS
ncbi:7049_t:CDS:1 [Paraglomus occultum]|uniref:7049_t:CDS:1 n=1 Tax=Paraglomus occultum TaxID=144539 RepID=A0A9N9BZL5_9GLOM|nr:7049_t:CDS:1 [Paraglomus occultum]